MAKLLALLFGGTASLLIMLLHRAGPALVLLAISPFDGIFFTLFGQLGNVITYVPILYLLVRTSPGRWGELFLGTRVQVATAVLMLALFPAHALVVSRIGVGVLFGYARLLTLFLLVGLFAWYMRDERNIESCVKVLVVSMAAFMFLSGLDFFGGIQVLPTEAGSWGSEGLLGQEGLERGQFSEARFTGAGLPINRTGNWLVLPIITAVGWLMSPRESRLSRSVALGCLVMLAGALAATVSRASLISVGIGVLILLPTAFRFRVAQVGAIAMVSVVAIVAVVFVMQQFGITEAFMQRFESDKFGGASRHRMMLWGAAFRMWASSPLIGVGMWMFAVHSPRFLPTGATLGAHNAYFKLLAETGLLGFLPYMVLLTIVLLRLMRSVKRFSPTFEYWRPYFLASFVAFLFNNMGSAYGWERLVWFSVAFAVALERVEQVAVRRSIRERHRATLDQPLPAEELARPV